MPQRDTEQRGGLYPARVAGVAIRRTASAWLEPQSVFGMYAVVAWVAGASIAGTGIRGIPGASLEHSSFIWLSGMAVVFAGFAASGLALNSDPLQRRRALYRFATGHLLLGFFAWFQWGVYWGSQGVPQWVALAPLVVGIVLTGIARAWSSGGADPGAPTPLHRIRSTYEEHIRQLARREERARLARDLHDAVKQQLFVIQTAAATAHTRLDHDREGTRAALDQARAAAREATTEMEALLDELQARPLENTGLVEALKKQCEALALRSGAVVHFEPGTMPAPGRVPPGAHEAIYRVAQEALANVGRHARASQVTVSLVGGRTNLRLRVVDNGHGFDSAAVRRGMGMNSMIARAAAVGGHVAINSGPAGTEVILVLPLVNVEMRVAWALFAGFLLLVLSLVVFHGIRGHAPEQPPILTTLFGVLASWRLVAAYRRQARERSQ